MNLPDKSSENSSRFRDIRLIACDLDGTLLDSRKSIPASTLEAIRQCRQRDMYFGIATARSAVSAQPVIDLVRPDFCILNGGALVTAGGETILRSLLDADTVRELICCFSQSGQVSKITVETPDAYRANYFNPAPEYVHAILQDFSQPFAEEAFKVTIESGNPEFIRELASGFPGCDVLRFHGEDWYRFARRGAGKWQGIEAVLARFGLRPDQVCAFGDDYNDLEMLQHAGFGVAMANAAPEVKAAARHHTSGNDTEGVARFLRRILQDQQEIPE